MNAVDRVRERYRKAELPYRTEGERMHDNGYYEALDDVEKELEKIASNDWETEYNSLFKEMNELKKKHSIEINQLKQKYECEIAEFEKKFEYEDKETTFELECAKRERDMYKAKYEVVELIFGGQ